MDKTHPKPKHKQINPDKKTKLCPFTVITKAAVYITAVRKL